MQIEMLRSHLDLAAGRRYDLAEAAADRFIRTGYARRVTDDWSATDGAAGKAIQSPPRDKAIRKPRRAKGAA